MGHIMKKFTTISILLLSLLSAAENNESKYTQEEISKMSPESKMLYMPDIITPEELKSGAYGGLGLSFGSLSSGSTSIFSQDIGNNRMMGLSVLAGYNINKYVATEARALISTGYDDSVDFTSWGIYIKPQYEVYKDVKIYSLIGYGSIDASKINSEDLKVNSGSAQLGIGADYKLGKNFKVFADYLYLGKDDEAKYNNQAATMKSSAITTGITYDF